MKVLLITGTYYPSVNGVSVSVADLKFGLEKMGHEVFLFAPKNRSIKFKDGKNVFRFSSVNNPKHKDYPIPLLPSKKFILESLKGKIPDIVHVHHPYQLGFFAKTIADYFNAPLIFTFHSNYDVHLEKYFRFLPKKVTGAIMKNQIFEFCKKADIVVTPAEHTKNKILKKLPNLKVEVVPNGVSFQKKITDKPNEREKLGLGDKKILLYVGRLSIEKDVQYLIKALCYLPEKYVLMVVGDGPDRSKLEKEANILNLKNRVLFKGILSHSKLPSVYSVADVFFFASETETQGLVFLEAMFFGLPIVTVESEAADEWVKKDYGLIVKKDPKKLAEGVLKLIKRNRKKMGLAEQKIAGKYSTQNTAKKMISVYEKAIRYHKKS